MQNAIPGKNKFIERQYKEKQKIWEKKKDIQAHLNTLFLLKPLITSNILPWYETHPIRNNEGMKH